MKTATEQLAVNALKLCQRELAAWMADHGEDIGSLQALCDSAVAIVALEADIAQPVESIACWQVFQNDAWEWCLGTEVAFYKSCNKPVRPLYATPQAVPVNAELLTAHEQKAVLADLMGLECLINYHDVQETEYDAMEPGAGSSNAARALELLAIGRTIIAEDPEIWFDEQKAAFALRHSEKQAAPRSAA